MDKKLNETSRNFKNQEEKENTTFFYLWIIIIIAWAMMALFWLSGCKSIQYVPVETTKTEYRDVLQRDSIFVQDSIFVKMKNDTVWLERYKTLYRDKLIRDSVFIRDSIQIPYPVETVKEVNHLRGWQVILMIVGALAIGYCIYGIVRKLR